MKHIFTIVEDGYTFNNRFIKIINGIAHASKSHNFSFTILQLDDIKPAQSNRQPIIVVGASVTWTTSAVQALSRKNYHPIVIGFDFQASTCTFITQNHYLDAYTQTYRCLANNRLKPAFLGLNPLSFCDQSKYAGFKAAIKISGHRISNDDVFPITTATGCVDTFLNSSKKYDTVFCVNDTIALILISKLKDPQRFNIVSFGDLFIKRYCSVPFRSLSPNYYNMGRIAVDIFSTLSDYPYVSTSTIYVTSKFNFSGDAFMPEPSFPSIITDPNLFSDTERVITDENTQAIDIINNALEHCDETDLTILKYLQKDMTYEQTAENLYMSTNSVKRRLKKILTNTGFKSKTQFLATVAQFKLDFTLDSAHKKQDASPS